ncbi:MAG: ribose ABC transporter permease, partial [Deltaproteobacteria bacterium]
GMSFAGGEGTPVGSMLGGLLLVVIGNALNMVGISPFYQYIVKGVIFLTAVAIHGRQRRHS